MMKQNGFTLVELLIVIAIAGILLAITTLNFGQWTSKSNIEAQIREMYADLMNARIHAINTNRNHFVTFLTSTQYTITDDTSGTGAIGPPPVAPATTVIVSRTVKNQIAWAGGTGSVFYFDTRGIANNLDSNNLGTISLANTSGAVFDCILISQTRTNMGKMNGGSCVPR